MRIFQNYHRHSSYSNTRVSDSVVYNEDYAKRAVELGHGIISTMEHGWQGRYIEGYELANHCFNFDKENDTCKKCGGNCGGCENSTKPLKFVFGTEAYFVKDRYEKDDANCHICIFARNENARQSINDILSEANITGFYSQPRIDLDLIYSLPSEDVIITSACVGFWKYEDADNIVKGLHNYFKNNFYLEVQYHNTPKQKDLNSRIKELAKKLGIKMIMGCDSHYITDSTSWERDDYLESKGMRYPDEDGWYMDYPDGDTAYERFITQGILTEEEINEAFESTNVFLEVEEYNNPCFTHDVKMPILPSLKHLSQTDRDEKYSSLIWELWGKESANISNFYKELKEDEIIKIIIERELDNCHRDIIQLNLLSKEELIKTIIDHYVSEISKEVQTVIEAIHSDYFLMNYELIKKSVEKGGMITNSGRGSAVSFITNKLLGFTKVDRIASKVKMYPERFMSASRILEAKTLADIDFNVGNPEIFAETQKELFGEECAYPMIAYGKYKASSAFKMYAKAKQVPFDTANEITAQIKQYEKDLAHAEDDEKDDIQLPDYIDEQYHQILEDSERYLGIISSWSPHPCAHLIYQGDIRREIGLIMMRSNQGKKLTLCSLMDGLWAEQYKFLKNDLLKVNVVKLIKLAYADAGIEEDDVTSLLQKSEYNQKVNDIYKKGYTLGINQVEQRGTKNKMMTYQSKNITELTAFVAAIRPSFKSMFKVFQNREHFDYGIKVFDDIIQTPEMTSSFILYQEMIMAALNFAGIQMSECYEVIKCISKKRKDKILKYEAIFVPNFTQKIIEIEHKTEEEALEASKKIWQIIHDSARYGFNASHAYCVALDSLYGAYLKAYYPLNFYKSLLNILNDKGDKDKISLVVSEMNQAFKIEMLPLRFRQDNRTFSIEYETNSITGTLKSIKGIGDKLADQLYELKDMEFNSFIELLIYIEENSIMCNHIQKLISVDYFEEFGKAQKLLDIFKEFDSGINRYSRTHKENTKQKRIPLLIDYEKSHIDNEQSPIDKLKADIDVFGEPRRKNKELKRYLFIKEVNTKYSPRLDVITVTQGVSMQFKMRKDIYNQNVVVSGDIIRFSPDGYREELDGKYVGNKYVKIPNTVVYWLDKYEKVVL